MPRLPDPDLLLTRPPSRIELGHYSTRTWVAPKISPEMFALLQTGLENWERSGTDIASTQDLAARVEIVAWLQVWPSQK